MQIYSNIRNTSGFTFLLGKWFLLACTLVGLTACQSLTTFSEDSKSKLGKVLRPYRPDMVQGNFIAKEQLDLLRIGMSFEEVFVVMGTPLHLNIMRQNRADYISMYKKNDENILYQRVISLYFENLKLTKIEADAVPTEHELIAEIDDFEFSRRPQRKAVTQELESQHPAPTVQTIPNPTQGVGIPRGDTRN